MNNTLGTMCLVERKPIQMKRRYIDQLIIGFALFSMFFGAGNIIFPPYLGLGSGTDWFAGFSCYYLADIGLSIVAIFALIKNGGDIANITDRIGKIPGEIMVSAIILCIGPFIALPRTGATVHEMFTIPVIGDVSPVITTSIFFLIVMVLTLRESAVVDIIGKFLTPALLLGLIILIILGIISPIGEISAAPMMDNVIVEGINAGYQTMDVLAAMIFGIIIVKNVIEKGYTETHLKYKVARNASLVAAAALLIVYCGLTYLGATASKLFTLDINRSELILNITESLMGKSGVVILGIIVTLACLTTAVALVSASADYFSTLTKGNVKYTILAVIICIFSAVIANIGIDKIVLLAQPILSLVYPGALTLIVLSLFSEHISNFTIRGAVIGAIFGSFCEILYAQGIPLNFVPNMPLVSIGIGWVTFVVIFGIIGFVLEKISKATTN